MDKIHMNKISAITGTNLVLLGMDVGMIMFCSGGLFILFGSNSDVPTDIPGLIMVAIGFILFIVSGIKVIRASH